MNLTLSQQAQINQLLNDWIGATLQTYVLGGYLRTGMVTTPSLPGTGSTWPMAHYDALQMPGLLFYARDSFIERGPNLIRLSKTNAPAKVKNLMPTWTDRDWETRE